MGPGTTTVRAPFCNLVHARDALLYAVALATASEALDDGEARICVFVSGGLFREPFAKVFSAELEPAKAN